MKCTADIITSAIKDRPICKLGSIGGDDGEVIAQVTVYIITRKHKVFYVLHKL